MMRCVMCDDFPGGRGESADLMKRFGENIIFVPRESVDY